MNRLTPIFALILTLSLVLSGQPLTDLENKSKIAFTPHNLSLDRESVIIDSILLDFTLCSYCHIPNKTTAVEPLWYHEGAVPNYDLQIDLPDDDEHVHPLDPSSRSCLFCHDGSMAPGFPHRDDNFDAQVNLTSEEPVAPAGYNMHLFKFPAQGQEILVPEEASSLSLVDGQVSCITCHDPHNNELGNFLRVSNENSGICMECHQMQNWELSTHGNPQNPLYPELKEVACLQCHEIHTLPTRAKLLRADENTLCFSCHDGSLDHAGEVAAEHDLQQVFEKTFTHPVRVNPNVTRMGYGAGSELPWDYGLAADRFVRCGDCHNPHAAGEHSVSPQLDGSLAYASGVDALGFPLSKVDHEYEICYKCHGQNQNTLARRNVGHLLAAGNMSFHPVEQVGNSHYVPSLKAGWSEQSLVTCSDCHGNDDPFGPAGPHGSSIPHILKDNYSGMPFGALEDQKLCFECHDSRRIRENVGFRFHSLHIDGAGYSCAACHNPHGSPDSPGLFDLNKPFILPIGGKLEVMGLEPGHGTCTLECHDVKHTGQTY